MTLETASDDFTLVTYVLTDTTAKQAGISIRNGSANNGDGTSVENVSLLARPGNASGGSFQYRTSPAGGTTTSNLTSVGTGEYLAIRRAGTTFYAYVSADGLGWTQVGSETVGNMSGTVTIDLVGAGTAPYNYADFAGATFYDAAVVTETPASSSNVVAVGGTVVATNGAGTITDETSAWGNGTLSYWLTGGGGGYSNFEGRPAYQDGVSSNSERAVADVSLDGGTAVAIYDSDNASPGWDAAAGTSFSAPAWAALLAVADQGRALVGLAPLTSSQTVTQPLPTTQTLLYTLPSADFNDIGSGSNGAYSAHGGYDLVTGLGTPYADKVAADMSAWVQNGGFETGTVASSLSGIGWTATTGSGGSPTVTTTGVYDGTYAAKLPDGSSISQTITGLEPNTRYTVSVFGKVDSGNATLNISGYGDSSSVSLTSASYGQEMITFTTGASATSATITLSSATGISGNDAYFDDVTFAPEYVFTAQGNVTISQSATTLDISDGTNAFHIPLSAPRPVTIATGANNYTVTIDQSVRNATLPGGLIVQGTGRPTLVVDAGSYTFDYDAGAQAGNLTVDASNGATVTFTAAQTFAQLTIDTGATAIVNSELAGNVVLNAGISGAILGGSGTIAGNVSGSGTIHPSEGLSSTAATTLTLGSLTTSSTMTLAFNLVSPDSGSGSQNDLIIVTGNLNISDTPPMEIVANSTGLGSLGYYKAIQYDTITGLPANAAPLGQYTDSNNPNVVYVAYSTRDFGFIDIHRGLNGDADDSGVVNLTDFVAYQQNFSQQDKLWGGADFNGDRVTNLTDFVTWSQNFGKTLNESGMGMMALGSDVSLTDEQFAEILSFVQQISPSLSDEDMAMLPSLVQHLATFTPDNGASVALYTDGTYLDVTQTTLVAGAPG